MKTIVMKNSMLCNSLFVCPPRSANSRFCDSSFLLLGRTWIWLLICGLLLVPGVRTEVSLGSDFVQLNAKNWKEFAPAGKEVDAIYGDYVLRNDRIVAVIAHPNPGRNANLTIRNIGGFILDLTTVEEQNDQLGCYFPLGGAFHFHDEKKLKVYVDDQKVDFSGEKQTGKQIKVTLASSTGPDGERAIIEYTLRDGADALEISHLVFRGDELVRVNDFNDAIRADRTFKVTVAKNGELFLANDDWFRQCYGCYLPKGKITIGNRNRGIEFKNPSESTSRFLMPASSLPGVTGLAAALAGESVSPVRAIVEDPNGRVSNAVVRIKDSEGDLVGQARTNAEGEVGFPLPNGTYEAEITATGQPAKTRRFGVLNQREVVLRVGFETAPPIASGRVVDESGTPVPCKVGFYGKDGTADPNWGPDSAANPVGNLFYSHDGNIEVALPAGKYDVIISRGPEHDAEFRVLDFELGKVTKFEATLERVVDTKGWVSAEYHSHSTPSGDNTSDQLGRVLNLLAENLEFAPCTEHQRVDSYTPHLKALQAEKWMATCSGMELTGNPLPLNHQNAFPLVHKPRTQDGGGPKIHPNPIVQIERLAYWDNRSEKVVQINHPNLFQMAGDADLDGKPDQGFRRMFDYMDVMEIHPPEKIFLVPDEAPTRGKRGNVIFNWLQMLNQGHRIVGVVNTDAHYNLHGSGWIRNYIKSSTDDPASISTMEMVKNSKQGHVVMTTGPFLEVSVQPAMDDKKTVGPGDDLQVRDGKVRLSVRIQCANWLDVNRVQVFLNGRMANNFTRRQSPTDFRNGVVKFEQDIALQLKEDTHIVVATIGEGLTLGRVMGSQYGNRPPCAVSNPIYVDVDGDGFQPNGDKLDSPLLYGK